MIPDIQELSLEELRALKHELEPLLTKRRNEALERLREEATSLGFTADEFFPSRRKGQSTTNAREMLSTGAIVFRLPLPTSTMYVFAPPDEIRMPSGLFVSQIVIWPATGGLSARTSTSVNGVLFARHRSGTESIGVAAFCNVRQGIARI